MNSNSQSLCLSGATESMNLNTRGAGEAMALVRKFELKARDRRPALHHEISATYSSFEHEGGPLLQIDTYGRSTRENPGKQSQTIQLDRRGATALYNILKKTFRLP